MRPTSSTLLRQFGVSDTTTIEKLQSLATRSSVPKDTLTRSAREELSADTFELGASPDFRGLAEACASEKLTRFKKVQEMVGSRRASDLLPPEKRQFDDLMTDVAELEAIGKAASDLMGVGIVGEHGRHVDSDPFGGDVRTAGSGDVLRRSDTFTAWLRRNGHSDGHRSDVGVADLFRAAAGIRSLNEGTGSAGGYLVPTPLSARIIDMARARSRVVEAGALTVPMESQTLKVAKVVSDPTPAWRNELASIAEDEGELGQVTLTARSLSFICRMSMEALEDAVGLEEIAKQSMAAAMALEIDRVAMYGTGTAPEPRGIRNAAGISVLSPFGTAGTAASLPTDYDPLLTAEYTLAQSNMAAGAAIMHPRTELRFSTLKDTTGQPLRKPEKLQSLPMLPTTQVPINRPLGAASDTSDIIVGDFSHLMIGIRTQLQIRPLVERYADTGEIGFLAWWRGDVQVARGEAFVVSQGYR